MQCGCDSRRQWSIERPKRRLVTLAPEVKDAGYTPFEIETVFRISAAVFTTPAYVGSRRRLLDIVNWTLKLGSAERWRA